MGLLLQSLGVSGTDLLDAGPALVNYILGSAAQYAAGARHASRDEERKATLAAIAAQWAELDDNPVVREAASLLVEHDDREQFLAGVNIFLAGITIGGTWRG